VYVDLIGAYQQRHGRELTESVKAQNERLQQQAKEVSAEAAERLAQRRERDRARARERYHRARQQEREAAQREHEGSPVAVTEAERTRAVLAAMPVDERISYELEQVLPLTMIAGATEEDLDPTLVPKGCPSCWRTGGGTCTLCPDPNARTRCRLERKQGLVLRAT
jgi:DNA segregation ATPase FtsK/SpoIIIE-like protein